jgi:hypothetical protein
MHVLVVSFSDLGRDPRVDRQIAALSGRYRVTAAGLAPPRLPVDRFIDISAPPRRKLGMALGLARLVARRYEAVYWGHPANVAVFERLSGVDADVVLANDLEALGIALRLGQPVVFDAHEYAPDQFNDRIGWRLLRAPYARWQCERYVPRVAAMTTVSQGLADRYEHLTGVRATIVTNAPAYHELEPTPVGRPIRVLHHGGAMPGRGLPQMIEVAELLDDRFTVDFVLLQDASGYREKLIRRARGNPRVRFPPAQPMHTLVRMANDYDIGLFLLPPVSVQRRYALPNKFFEFIQARLAVAIGPSPEMARLVRQYGCGIVADDFEPATLAAELNRLDAASIAAYKQASNVAARALCAERNEEFVLAAIERALETPSPPSGLPARRQA